MFVCGVDPGRTTGLVLYDSGSKIVFDSCLASSEEEIIAFLDLRASPVIVVEDFLGSGPRSADTVFTLKLLGFIVGWGTHHLEVEVCVQPPQWRKAFLDEAQQTFRVHKHRHLKDALAHIFAYLDRIGET